MPTLSPAQIYALARDVGQLDPAAAAVATAVALAESGGRTDAEGDIGLQDGKWGPSIGLWQIRSLKAEYGKGQSVRDGARLKDPQFNAFAMATISNHGKNFNPWTTYTSGAYKKRMPSTGDMTAGELDSMPGGGLTSGVNDAFGNTVDGVAATAQALTGWAGDAMKVALYVVGAGAAVGLVIVGAVHTVSSK
jgi:hypothetical protein